MSGALDLPQLVALASEGNRRAVGRLLSVVEQGGALADTVTSLTHQKPSAHVVGFTGAPGAGKSTLIGQLVHHLCQQNQAPAVLAVDPSSPLTGGAILGDRIRMDHLNAGQAFIRSAATRGHQGGLALSVPGSMRVFSAAGYHPVIIETVGVGQVEVDVAAAADTTVVVVNPGWGDAVQANKSGLLEVADIFVINKADRPGAQDTRRDLELMLELSHVSGQEDPTGYRPPIIMATATTGDGFNNDREPDFFSCFEGVFLVVDSAITTGDDRHFGFDCHFACLGLVAEVNDRFGAGPDKLNAALAALFCEVGVFREEAVTGVNAIHIRDFGGCDDAVTL